jgi:polyisoprenoid-binding protein YceI
MASTKVGLVTTSFHGYVKKFSLNYVLEGDKVKFAKLSLPVEQMDTDSEGRNSKMREQCLDYRKHPEIVLTLTETLPIDGQIHSVPATISLRGADRPIVLNVKARRDGRKILAEIDGALSLKELEVPDPSIFVARVRDRVDLKASLEASD